MSIPREVSHQAKPQPWPVVWLPGLMSEFCRLGWRHWPCVWSRTMYLDLITFTDWPGTCFSIKNLTTDLDPWLQLLTLAGASLLALFWCCETLVSETSACLVITLCFWLPCPCRSASSCCSLIWRYWQFPATDMLMESGERRTMLNTTEVWSTFIWNGHNLLDNWTQKKV